MLQATCILVQYYLKYNKMIANILKILLCCFIITLNIKTIESVDNKIYPVRYTNVSFYDNYIRTINKCKTFNEHPVIIERAQQRSLSTLITELNRNEYRIYFESQVTFEKKMQDIRCTFCVIAKSNILRLKDLVENLKRGEPFINFEDDIKRLEREANMLVELMLHGNLGTGKWLWSYYLKTIAIRSYGDNRTLINKNPFDDDQLQTGVSNFIDSCITAKNLPSTVIKSDFVSKNMAIYKKMFSDLRVNSEFHWFNLHDDSNNYTIIEFIYLKPFWDDERELLFGQITGANVDWSAAKQRHEFEMVITREFLENRTWMHDPYGRLDHQQLLVNIIDARIYCYLSVILHAYEILFTILDVLHWKHTLIVVIKYGLEVTAFKDSFLVDILSDIELSSEMNTDDTKEILARIKTKANSILNDLMGPNANAVERLSIDLNVHQLSSDHFMHNREFHNYLINLRHFLPLQYKVLLNFVDVVKMPAA